MDCCVCGNEPSGFVRCGKFHEFVRKNSFKELDLEALCG